MNDERDEILDELTKLVNVDLAPDFHARVQRTVAQRASSSPALWWIGAMAAAVVGVVVVTGPRVVLNSTPHGVHAAVRPAPPAPGTVAPAPTVAIVPVRVRASTMRTPSPRTIRRSEVLVPADQAIALDRLVADIKNGRLILAPVAGNDAPVEIPPLPAIEPVTIKALPGEGAGTAPNSDSGKVEAHGSIQA